MNNNNSNNSGQQQPLQCLSTPLQQPQQQLLLSNIVQNHYVNNNLQPSFMKTVSPISMSYYSPSLDCSNVLTPITPSSSNQSSQHSPQLLQHSMPQTFSQQTLFNKSVDKQENICDMISSLMTYDAEDANVNVNNQMHSYPNIQSMDMHDQKAPISNWYNINNNKIDSNTTANYTNFHENMYITNNRQHPTSIIHNPYNCINGYEKVWPISDENRHHRKESLPSLAKL